MRDDNVVEMIPVVLQFNCGTRVPGFRVCEFTPDGPTLRTIEAPNFSLQSRQWQIAETYRVRRDYNEVCTQNI